MSVLRALRRLQQVLEIEEEQYWLAMESSINDLKRITDARRTADHQAHRARGLIFRGAELNAIEDRLAGMEEACAAARLARVLEPRIAAAEAEVARRRAEFLSKRVERRQTETLVESVEQNQSKEQNRRAQQALDDWYLDAARRKTSR